MVTWAFWKQRPAVGELDVQAIMQTKAAVGNDDEYVVPLLSAIGKTIAIVEVHREGTKIEMRFVGGTNLRLMEGGPCCCGDRFMTCDDDLKSFSGAVFLGLEKRPAKGPSTEDKDGRGNCQHDMEFLVIHTTSGDIVIDNHNVHNGYYEGFRLSAEEFT